MPPSRTGCVGAESRETDQPGAGCACKCHALPIHQSPSMRWDCLEGKAGNPWIAPLEMDCTTSHLSVSGTPLAHAGCWKFHSRKRSVPPPCNSGSPALRERTEVSCVSINSDAQGQRMRITGKWLNKKYKLGAADARYRENGVWYHPLRSFPAILFDGGGYVLFPSEGAYWPARSFAPV